MAGYLINSLGASHDDFAAPFSVGDAFLAFDASTIFVNGFLFGGFVFLFSAAAVGFADAGQETVIFVEARQGAVGVIAFAGDELANRFGPCLGGASSRFLNNSGKLLLSAGMKIFA